MSNFREKYLKYKTKYIQLKNQRGGKWDCNICKFKNIDDNAHCDCGNTKEQTDAALCVSNISTTHAAAAAGSSTDSHIDAIPLIHVNVQNMAGDVLPINIEADESIGMLKQRIYAANALYPVAQQRLAIMHADSTDGAHTVLDDERTLESYGIANDSTIHIFVEIYEPGQFIRTFGSEGSGNGQFNNPRGICISPDGEYLYVADSSNNRVQVLRASDGECIRIIDEVPGHFNSPSFVCLSHNDTLFVTDAWRHYIEVFRASDGSHIKGFGSRAPLNYPSGICLSLDNQNLFVADQERVQVLHAEDGAFMRMIGSNGNGPDQYDLPCGLCLSPDGELLYIADSGNHRVQVFQTVDGAFMRSIGSNGPGNGPGQFYFPQDVCISPNGEYLFIIDLFNNRVQVMRASDGEHVHTIGSAGSENGQFQQTRGICLSPNGRLLFVSDGNNRIQVFATFQ